jgi:hypothetical protein
MNNPITKENKKFFPNSNLNIISFYFHCQNIKEEDKKEICEYIINNKGVR